jgi:alkylated DNA nucleotide flippase Atl1
MKATKFILSIFFIIYSVQGFSQTIQDVAICAKTGSSASFTVDYPTASTYEWEVKLSGLWTKITGSNSGSIYSGYSSSTLNIIKSLFSPLAGTLYRVKVIDGFNISTYSNEAELIIDPVPISKTISVVYPVCAGASKNLIYALGSVGTIYWQSSSTSNPNDFYDIDGENLGSYTATDLQDTTWFRVKNSSGECGSVFSPAVQVVVNPLPVAGNIDGGDVTVCSGSNTTPLTLLNSTGTIQWQKASEVAGSPGTPGTFANISLAILPNYNATNLTATTYFRAVLSSGVCETQITEPVVIYVDPKPVSKLITGASAVCEGADKTLTFGTGSVGDILWQYSTTSATSDFFDLDGETEPTYTASVLQETTWFRVMNSSGECGSVFSPAVQVVVNPLPEAGNIDGGDVTVCSGSSTTLTLLNSTGTIQWQKALDVAGSPGTPGTFANIFSAILPNYSATNLTATTYFRAVLSSGVCATEITDPVVMIVEPKLISKLITGTPTPFTGGSITLTYGAGWLGDIQWQYSTISGSEGFFDLDGEIEGTYTAIDLQKTTWFRVMNTNGVCSVYSTPFQVLFNSLAVPVFVDVDSKFKVVAYPNPFDTEFNINLTLPSPDPIELKIYDMLGRLIENHYINPSEINSIRMGTTYPPGFFTVLIKQGQQERNVKVLKK